MKRSLSGFVFGVVLTLALPAIASNMIGKAVDSEYPVLINGKMAPKVAVVINGTSYLPTRYIAETAGYNVDFKNNQVLLSNSLQIKEVAKLEQYKVVSDIVYVDPDPACYSIKDGNWYYPIAIFGRGNYVKYDIPDIVTVTMPWGNVATIQKSKPYEPGADGYVENNRTLVNITSLGLKPVINGNEVKLERI